MAETVEELLVKLNADISGFKGGMRQALTASKLFSRKASASFTKVRGSINKMGSSLTSIKGLLAGLGAGLIGKQLVDAFKVQEQAVASLDAAIFSMGRTTEGLSVNLQKVASQIQREGIIGDEALIQGQSFLATFTDITDELLPRTTRVMADLAAKTGSTENAAKLLGKASMGLVGALSIAGISLSDATKESKDFEAILGEIEDQVGGLNAALGNTATGAMTQLSNAFGDLQEEGGKFLALALERPFRALTTILLNDLDSSLKTNEDSAREFGRTIVDAIETGAKVVGVFADGIHGIGIIVDLLKAGLQGFSLLVGEIFAGLTIIVEEFINSAIRGFNSIADLAPDLSEALGISRLEEIDLASSLVADVEITRAALNETLAEVSKTLKEELPSTGIENKMKQIRDEFDKVEAKAKESTINVTKAMAGGGEGGAVGGGEASEKFLTDLQNRVDALRDSNLTELEILQEKFTNERLLTEAAFENKLLDEEDFMSLREEVTQRHQDTLFDIEMERLDKVAAQERMMNKARLEVATGMLDNLTTLMDSGSKKQFRIGKLAAKATVVIKGIEAVQSAYAAGNATGGGPIVGAAYAATAAIASAQQLSKINAAQFGGGGSISAPGGTNPATGGAGTVPAEIPSQLSATGEGVQATQEPKVVINIQGSVFNSDETVDLLAEQISEAVEGRGVRLVAAETV